MAIKSITLIHRTQMFSKPTYTYPVKSVYQTLDPLQTESRNVMSIC